MRSKVLAKVMGNAFISKVAGTVGSFYINHESLILTTGTIGFSLATTAVTYKNAARINEVLYNGKCALSICNSEEEKKSIYRTMLMDLTGLVAPIIIFQSATIACSLFSKKQYDKKLAEAAGALSIAQAAIAQYQSFQKQAETALGAEEYEKLQQNIYAPQEVDGRRFTAIASEGAPGEVLIIDKYSGRPFWCTTDRIENAAREYSRRLTPSGGYDQQSINDLYELIGNSDLTPTDLGEKFGHIADYDFNSQEISAHFVDTHYVFPNGTCIPAFEMYLYPEPAYIDMGC